MKKFLMAVAAVALVGSAAFAGPNNGGVIFLHDASTSIGECGAGSAPSSCEAADTEIDGSDNSTQVWKVYAAFKPCTAPRLKAMTFGITYSDFNQGGTLYMSGHGPCIGDTGNGAAEFADPGWPASGTGDVIVWQYTQTTLLVEAYWFAGYAYYGAPSVFALNANPDPGLGGMFADDSLPALQDPIAGYGTLGFNEPGSVVCPSAGAEGACCVGAVCTMTCEGDCAGNWLGSQFTCDPNPCVGTGACCLNNECFIMTQTDCEGQGGRYYGDNSTCPQQDCGGGTPTHESTWGHIKAQYR